MRVYNSLVVQVILQVKLDMGEVGLSMAKWTSTEMLFGSPFFLSAPRPTPASSWIHSTPTTWRWTRSGGTPSTQRSSSPAALTGPSRSGTTPSSKPCVYPQFCSVGHPSMPDQTACTSECWLFNNHHVKGSEMQGAIEVG